MAGLYDKTKEIFRAIFYAAGSILISGASYPAKDWGLRPALGFLGAGLYFGRKARPANGLGHHSPGREYGTTNYWPRA